MKILYIHQYFCTPRGTTGTRSYEFAKRWVAEGHSVRVLTSTGYDASLQAKSVENIDGITVQTIGGRYSPEMGAFARIWAFVIFALHAIWIAARSREFDVVLATSTPITVALPAAAARWIARRPVVFEVRDVWPDAAIDAGVLKNPFLIWIARAFESLAYRSAHHLVPLSDGMLERMEKKGVTRDRMTMLPNCSDLERFGDSEKQPEQLMVTLNAEERFVLLYVGAINLANDIEFLAECIDRLRADDVVWWFVGGGNRLEYLATYVAERGIENVVLWGKARKEDVPAYVSAADVGVVSFIGTPTYFENSPNKFFDYCAGRLPSLFTRTTWLGPYLEKYQAGYVCETNEVQEFCEKVRMLASKPELCKQVGRNARIMAEKEFSRDEISAKYLVLLEEVALQASGGDAVQRATQVS